MQNKLINNIHKRKNINLKFFLNFDITFFRYAQSIFSTFMISHTLIIFIARLLIRFVPKLYAKHLVYDSAAILVKWNFLAYLRQSVKSSHTTN